MAEKVSRRAFIGTAAAAGVAGVVAGPSQAADRAVGAKAASSNSNGESDRLPRRGEFTIRDAYILSMDAGIGDVRQGSIHVRNGRIIAVGENVRGGGERIDGRDTIVMPGLVDTHWHLWTTLYRSLAGSGDNTANGYFALNLRHGAVIQPDDIYQGVRLSAADAINSGVTHVHDWSHNLRSPAYADANLRALTESGIRGRFSYGTRQGQPGTEVLNLADVQRVHDEWFASDRVDGLLELGIAGRPPGLVGPAVYEPEYAKAQELGIGISYHANSNRAQGDARMIEKLGQAGMLGPHVQIIHALFTTAGERATLAETKTPVSVSPWSELLIGYGVTTVRELATAGVLMNLSVDTTPLTGTAEMFSVIRLALGLHRGQGEREFDLSARKVLEWATIDAARGMGIADKVGSLTPGKRADLIMLRADDLNMAPVSDVPNAVALAAGPQNVDTVVIDGRILKRDGRLTAMSERRIVAESKEALAGVLARAGTVVGARAASARRSADACCGS